MFVVAGDLLVPQILYVLGKLGFTCFSHSAHFFDWRWVDRRKLVPFRVLIFDLQYSLYIYIYKCRVFFSWEVGSLYDFFLCKGWLFRFTTMSFHFTK